MSDIATQLEQEEILIEKIKLILPEFDEEQPEYGIALFVSDNGVGNLTKKQKCVLEKYIAPVVYERFVTCSVRGEPDLDTDDATRLTECFGRQEFICNKHIHH